MTENSTTVYVLRAVYGDGTSDIEGVYSSREKAERARRTTARFHDSLWTVDSYRLDQGGWGVEP